jgi:hypothetical protein
MHKVKRLLKIFAAGLAALIAWELILENLVLRDPGGTSSPVFGRIYRPGIYLQGTEGYCKTRMNSLGMRGGEIPSKTSDEYRILILGDSYTNALQVSDDKTFVHLLQNRLAINTSRDIKIINAGRNGASPAYYIHLSEFYHSSMKPDYVVVQINDEDFTVDIFDDKDQEFYVRKEGADYVTTTNFRDYYIWRMFPFLKVIKPFVAFSTFKIALDKIPLMLEQRRNPMASGRKEFRPSADYTDIVDWTLKSLKNDYPHMAVFYLTLNKEESNIEILLKQSANEHGIAFLNIREIFNTYYQSHRQPANGFDNTMPGTGHMNGIGHTLAADLLSDFFMNKVFK